MPLAVLLDQDTLLLLFLESEEHVILPDAEVDFSPSYVDPHSGGPQEWSPKDELDSEVALYIHHHKIGKDEGVSHAD